jgi:flagellar protein FliL
MATAEAVDASASKGGGKKKLIIIVVVLLLVLGGGGAAALFMMKKKAAAEGAEGEEPAAAHAAPAHAKPSKDHPPTYVALDSFTVNLADKEAERYAQIAVTLEVDDPKFAEQMKGYMPSIRNAILLILSHKTSAELLDLAGKQKLAAEIARASVRPMGIEIEEEDEDEAEDAPPKEGAKKKKKKKKVAPANPVTGVHFANFIIQ